MKIKVSYHAVLKAITAAILVATITSSASADVFWNGSFSGNWSTAANWTGGLPSAGGAGNAVINPGAPFATPTVTTLGNTTVGQTYLSIGGGLNIVSGSLSTVDLITGIWGNSAAVSVTGGLLNIGNVLNMGAGGFDGDVNISGGTVTAPNLSINTLGGAGMDISGTGSFITSAGQFGNVTYWIGNNNITANGGAVGWAVNVDSLTQPGSLVLTAVSVPEPGLATLLGLGLTCVAFSKKRKQNQFTC